MTHFSQANNTPFAKKNLQNLYGYRGINQRSQQLINNNVIHSEIECENEYVKQFIQKLSKGQNSGKDNNITFEEFKKGIEKWRERTTTSPSGRHLGHYKILVKLNVTDYYDIKINYSEIILKTYYNIIMSAIFLGKPVKRWREITTCMIQKVPGVSKLDKLRVIHLFEADYNLILKVMWSRKTVWRNHENKLLNEGQAGSRPGCRAIDVALQKEMKYNYAKLTRTELITIDNDAKSCFDRILCNVAMLISQYYGVPLNYCELQATTLQETKFNIRTAL
jgi:hypothetical protein